MRGLRRGVRCHPLVMILLISLVNADEVCGNGMEADGFTVAFSYPS